MMTDSVSLALPNLRIVLAVVDRTTSTITLVRSNKKEANLPLGASPFEATSKIARISYAPDDSLVYIETIHGEDIFAELPTVNDSTPRHGRPVVYLDQKDWSTLAKTLYEPTKIPDTERHAAEKLIAWARNKKILLPMSSGHMAETCKWTKDEERYRLALTIVQLSSGWQMRDPLDVRRFELRQSFTSRFKGVPLQPVEVFTLEPHVIHGETRGQKHPDVPDDFPPDIALAFQALLSVSATFDTMLDADPVAMDPSPGWVERNQRFTDWLAGQKSRSSLQKRQSVDAFFVADTRIEIAEEAFRSGITQDEMSQWILNERDGQVAVMPCLGLFRETLQGMNLNYARWVDNHLTDLMYLTCAAGYADYVVAERSLAGYMQQALKRMDRPINVYRRVQDLVPILEKQLE
jgi:PHD/YefM family antitoxin component YafN of YafNO toxin-antitoxin module